MAVAAGADPFVEASNDWRRASSVRMQLKRGWHTQRCQAGARFQTYAEGYLTTMACSGDWLGK